MEEFQMQPFRLRPTPGKLLSLLMLPLQTRGLARTDTINVVTKENTRIDRRQNCL